MKRFFCLLLAAAVVSAAVPAMAQMPNPFLGRWDLTLNTEKEAFPNWMEVVEKDGALQMRVQRRTGNVNPVASVKMDGAMLRVVVARAAPARPAEGNRPESPARPEVTWELTVNGNLLSGQEMHGGNAVAKIRGMRSPELKRQPPAAWQAPQPLFNGKDLSGWEPLANTNVPEFKWTVQNGELVNLGKGANIRTKREFDDFKLSLEFNVEPGQNSGVYLRGRYEVQVAAGPGGPGRNQAMGSVYGMVSPAVEIPEKNGQWQKYEITLIGRHVTIVLNGVTVVDNQEIPGITGGAIDSRQELPGPIYFQGDHTGVRFRNIYISVPVNERAR